MKNFILSSIKCVCHFPRSLISCIMLKNHIIYSLCKRYIDRYNGQNNHNIKTNGELFFMRKYLPNSKIVFDIGANVGDWTTEALNINPEIKLYCFEPSSSTFKILISRNFPPNVICKNLGFGSRVGKSILYGIGGVSSLSSLYSRQGLEHLGFRSEYTKELAIIDTVDNFCRENDIKQIDYLKLDVEGHELEVFKGMKELLKEGRVKIIQFEYGGCYIDARVFLVDIWNYIIELNPSYKFNKLYPKEIRLVPYYTQQLENFMLQNWALIKDE